MSTVKIKQENHNVYKKLEIEMVRELFRKSEITSIDSTVSFYRGAQMFSKEPLLFDPEKYQRLPTASNMMYATWLTISEPWKQFPNRIKSLICTTNLNTASYYGNIFLVFPLNNPVIGVCSEDDFWYSFPYCVNFMRSKFKTIGSYRDMNIDIFSKFIGEVFSSLDHFFNDIPVGVKNMKFSFDDIEYFYNFDKMLNKLDMYKFKDFVMNRNLDVANPDALFFRNKFKSDFFNFVAYLKGLGIFNFLDNVLDPKLNNFKKENARDLYFSNDEKKEAWFSGKAILFPVSNGWPSISHGSNGWTKDRIIKEIFS